MSTLQSYGFDISEILAHLGQPSKQNGDYYYWQCPHCLDKAKNNLVYNIKKDILKSFCCDSGKMVIAEIVKKLNPPKKSRGTNSLEVSETTVKLCSEYLLNNVELLGTLERERGINRDTVKKLKIGFSEECGCWVIPNYSPQRELIGFEFRTHDFKKSRNGLKLWRSKGKAHTLCLVHASSHPKNAVILEGFMDAFAFYQYLAEELKLDEYSIFTPSNGVNSISELMQGVDLSGYSRVIMLLDNDKQGKKALEQAALSLKYPVWEFRLNLNGYVKDFNEWYVKNRAGRESLFETLTTNAMSLAKSYIKGEELDHIYKTEVNGDFRFVQKIIKYKNCYFEIWFEGSKFCYRRLTNFSIDFCREIIKRDEKKQPLSSLEIKVTGRHGEKTEPFLLEGSSKGDIQEFIRTISYRGTYSNVLNSKHLAKIIDSIDSIEKIYLYESPGLVEGLKVWLYSNCAVDIETGEVFKANNEGIIDFNGKKIKSEIAIRKKPLLKFSAEYTPKELAHLLLENTLKTYSGAVEPLLVLGTAILAPFRDKLKGETNDGFPVCYIYGNAKSGKTNLAKTICALFGFNESYITLGSSTDNSIMDDLGKLNRYPAIINEYPRKKGFEDLLKSIYECTPREIMRRNGVDKITKEINSTAIFISNFLPPDSEQVMSRLNFTTFNSANFNVESAKGFNEVRDNHLSNLLPEILSFPEDCVVEYFRDYLGFISGLNPSISGRDANNLAVALCGISVLMKISGYRDYKAIDMAVSAYIECFNEICQTESGLDVFISYLTTLKSLEKIKYDRDYKFTTENKLALYLNDAFMNSFYKEYKQTTGEPSPHKKDILNAAKNDPRVDQGSGQLTKTVNINGKSRKCLVIDISNNEELEFLKG